MLGDEVEVSIQASTDTFISVPVDGQTLVYSNTKWRNTAAGSGGAFTAAKNTATSGAVTLTAGTSASAPVEGTIVCLYSFVTCSYEFNNARTILYAYEAAE